MSNTNDKTAEVPRSLDGLVSGFCVFKHHYGFNWQMVSSGHKTWIEASTWMHQYMKEKNVSRKGAMVAAVINC